jgi:hypothetical protein
MSMAAFLNWAMTCDTANERVVRMKTAEPVRKLALYASACCNEELLFYRNDSFSRCPKCRRLCFWKIVEEVVSWEEMNNFESEAA